MSPLATYVVETLITLFVIVGLAVVVLYVARRAGVGRPTGPLELVGRLPLDGRRAIYLVRVEATIYVLAASEAGLVKLGQFAREAAGLDESALAGAPPSKFSDVLERVLAGAPVPGASGSTANEPATGKGP